MVLGVALAVFLLLHLVPGDPAEMMLGDSSRPADRQALRQAMGLDLPLHRQLWQYLSGIARLDLGESLFSRRPVTEMLAERLPATLELAAAALALALAIAFPMGVLAARHKDGPLDNTAMGFSDRTAARLAGLDDGQGRCWWKRCSELRQFALIAPAGLTEVDSLTGREVRLCNITDHGRWTLRALDRGQPMRLRQHTEGDTGE